MVARGTWMRGIIRNESREVIEGPDHCKASQAFTRSKMNGLFMVFSTRVAGSHLGFKRLTLAAALRVHDKRINIAQTFSNQGA